MSNTLSNTLNHCTERRRRKALIELAAELEEFSHDGLILLADDLDHGEVVRGSWTGCVISYKRGRPGSTRRDRMGRARNAFTVLWDGGWITDEEVADAVATELSERVAVLADPA